MKVLRSAGGDELKVAATFCFTSTRNVQRHLEHDYHMIPRRRTHTLYEVFAVCPFFLALFSSDVTPVQILSSPDVFRRPSCILRSARRTA
jgi:hypothetical protein